MGQLHASMMVAFIAQSVLSSAAPEAAADFSAVADIPAPPCEAQPERKRIQATTNAPEERTRLGIMNDLPAHSAHTPGPDIENGQSPDGLLTHYCSARRLPGVKQEVGLRITWASGVTTRQRRG